MAENNETSLPVADSEKLLLDEDILWGKLYGDLSSKKLFFEDIWKHRSGIRFYCSFLDQKSGKKSLLQNFFPNLSGIRGAAQAL